MNELAVASGQSGENPYRALFVAEPKAHSRVRDFFTAHSRNRNTRPPVVRGPAHSQKNDKTPVLTIEEAHELLDSIEPETLINLRDRTLIYSFSRVGAGIKVRVLPKTRSPL